MKPSQRMLKRGLLVGAVLTVLALNARDWYVDPVNGSDATGDGTKDLPYETILRASTNASLQANETIWLEPGDYTNGVWVSGAMRARVYLTKGVTIRSTQGAAATRIHGVLSTDTTAKISGCGDDAVHCVYAPLATSVTAYIREVTLTEGGTKLATGSTGDTVDSIANCGAAVGGSKGTIYLVDSVVTNCAGHGGVISSSSAKAVRCRFVDNRGIYICRFAAAFYCLFLHNTVATSTGLSGTPAFCSQGQIVNCTVLWQNHTFGSGTSAKIVNSLFDYSSGTGFSNSGVVSNNVVHSGTSGSYAKNVMISPYEGDYRLVDLPSMVSLGALDAGDTNLWKYAGVSSAFYPAGPRFHVGCYDCVAPAGGELYMGSETLVNGVRPSLMSAVTTTSGSSKYFVVRPDVYPKSYRLLPVAYTSNPPAKIWNYWRDSSKHGGGVFPLRDGSVAQMPPANTNADVLSIVAQSPNKTLYVACDDENASDSNDGQEATPFKTIQAAVDAGVAAGVSRVLILVKPGTYDQGGATVTAGTTNFSVRVKLSGGIALRSTGGPAVTFIKGAPDPDTLGEAVLPGCGPKAVRCVYGTPNATACQIQGFTITGGYSDRDGAPADLLRGAAVYGGFGYATWVDDCVVSNCYAYDRIVYLVTLNRTRVTDNETQDVLVGFATSRSSLFLRNHSLEDSLFCNGSIVIYCTVAANDCATMWNTGIGFHNCLIDMNGADYGGTSLASGYGGNFVWNAKSGATQPSGFAGAFTEADALLVDPANGDVRMLANSPAIGRGAGRSTLYQEASADIDGNDLRLDGATYTPGCSQADFPIGVVIAADNGGLAIEGGKIGINVLKTGESLTIRPAAGGRPAVGLVVNGVTNLFASGSSTYTITAEDAAASGSGITVSTVYASDWYVSPAGSDDNCGYLPTAAFKTPAKALTNALLQAYDTVHLAAGRYEDEGMTTPGSNSPNCLSRVVVPSYVTLSGAGADSTFILGGSQVRCAYLKANARLENVTLCGARLATTDKYSGSYDELAGGAYAAGTSAVVADSVISNNVAYSRTAGAFVTFLRCRILDNTGARTDAGAPAGGECQYGHCYIDGNIGKYATMYGNAYNSTFGAGNLRSDKVATALFYRIPTTHKWPSSRAINCVFAGPVTVPTDSESMYYRHCLLAGDCKPDNQDAYMTSALAGEGSLVEDRATIAAGLNADGTPKYGSSAVDAGSVAWYDTYHCAGDSLDVDLNGGQRVYNGVLDMGAFEYDWREKFAKALKGRGLAITRAATNVTLKADGSVAVPAGDGLDATWAYPRAGVQEFRYDVTVLVVGEGTLAVTLNGEAFASVTAADGMTVLTFENARESNDFSFTFDGTGETRLLRFARKSGTVLILR